MAVHHDIGIFLGRILACAVDKQHIHAVPFAVECLKILHEQWAFAQQVKGGRVRDKFIAQPCGVWGFAVRPVIHMRGRIGQINKPNQKLIAGDVKVGARPVGGDDGVISHFPRCNCAANPIRAAHGDPCVCDKV